MRDYIPSLEEISSTEKLLELIRSKSAPSEPVEPDPSPQPRKKSRKRSFMGLFSLRKRITIGVDIGHSHLNLVKVAKTSEHRWWLIDYRSFPYNGPGFEKSPGFREFLKNSLIEFGVSSRKVSLWTMVSSAQADVRHVRIPKVAKKQIFNAVYWTVKRELQFDEKETFFDFAVQGDGLEKGIPKTAVVVYTIPRQDLKKVTDLFAGIGFRPAGLTIAPFAIQNLFRSRRFPHQPPAVAALYVGSSFARIDIYRDGNLVVTRGIKTGIRSMIEAILETYNEEESTISIDMQGEEQLSVPVTIETHRTMDREDAQKVFFCLTSPSDSGDEELASFNLNRWKVMEMIQPVLERLVRQMERTFEHYLSIPGTEPVGKIYISGRVASCKDILDHIGRQLGIEREVLDPLNPSIPVQSDVLAPDSLLDRTNLNAALGLALADNYQTPNILFSFQDKEKLERVARINHGILTVFVAVMGGLLALFFWLGHISDTNQAQLAKLQEELIPYGQVVDHNMLLMFTEKIKGRQQMLKQRSRRYLSLAVVSELCLLTPPNIRLIRVTADFSSLSAAPSNTPQAAGQQPIRAKSLVVDGIIRGDRQAMESILAHYVLKLGCSQLMASPTIQSSSFEAFEAEGEVLRFTLNLGIV